MGKTSLAEWAAGAGDGRGEIGDGRQELWVFWVQNSEFQFPQVAKLSRMQNEERIPKTVNSLDKKLDKKNDLRWSCPNCKSALEKLDLETFRCLREGVEFRKQQLIWRFLTPERQTYYQTFAKQYVEVRRAEGRSRTDSEYYLNLPFKDLSGRFRYQWKIRSKSYQALSDYLTTNSNLSNTGLRIVDLGAGNCWLSHRLTVSGHTVVAVDILDDEGDGLGAFRHYKSKLVPVQAEYDALPFSPAQFDVAIFNASFHYASNYPATLTETLRVLKAGGSVVIMDSPLYKDEGSGKQMVEEQNRFFTDRYGIVSEPSDAKSFLTFEWLQELSEVLEIRWEFICPRYGLLWNLRPWKAHLLGRREPAQFFLIVGTQPTAEG